MVDKICEFLTNKIRKEMPEIDDERAEVINYGLQNIIGEIPKLILTFVLAIVLDVFYLTFIAFVAVSAYRAFSGGFHAKTHLACIIFTNLFYIGNAYVSQLFVIEPYFVKYIVIGLVWLFSMFMIRLYAPADTENVPILRKKDRRNKKNLSYITMTITLLVAVFIKTPVISNIIIIGVFLQTLTITRIAYKLTNNKYGHEVYEAQEVLNNI